MMDSDEDLNEALNEACKYSNLEEIKDCIRRGGNPTTQNNKPIIFATMYNRFETVMYLISLGADPKEAFIMACQMGNIKLVKQLDTDYTIYIDAKNNGLVTASESGRLDVVEYLVSTGADPNTQDSEALICASNMGHLNVVKFLAERGVDLQAQDNEAIKCACNRGYINITKFLIEAGVKPSQAKINNMMTDACISGYLKIVMYLVEYARATFGTIRKDNLYQPVICSPDHTITYLDDRDFQTQINDGMIIACNYGYLEIVKFFISVGANPKAQDDAAIIYASQREYLNIVRYLVSIGVSLKRCTKKYKIILNAERIRNNFIVEKMRKNTRNLIPVYFSPDFTGGKLAKKELSNFITKLRTVCSK